VVARDEVKARKVGDSIVITLSRPILDEATIGEGEMLLLETTGNGRVTVSKASDGVSAIREAEMQLGVLDKRLDALNAEIDAAHWGISNSAPTEHFPWVDDTMVTDGVMRDYRWKRAMIELEIAEKRLEIYKLGGEPNGS
jgi:hypothetical protein